MPVRVKNSTITSRLVTSRPIAFGVKGNRGQAVIEYTLMLIISVALVLALSTQLFRPFGEFVSNYMGKYVGCLLEYGELPTLGYDKPSGPDEDSECNKKFVAATARGGRSPADNGGGSANSKSSLSSKDSSGSSGGGSSSTYAGSASRRGGNDIFGSRRPASGTDGIGNKDGGKVIEISLDGGGGSGSFFKGSGSGRYRGPSQKTTSIPMTALTENEKKKLKKKKEGDSKIAITSEGLGPAPKKIMVKKPEVKSVIPEDEPITIGNFMRYLLIAAIIIALIVFLGGQALQMSKSFEK